MVKYDIIVISTTRRKSGTDVVEVLRHFCIILT
jgi:hypothetical protein